MNSSLRHYFFISLSFNNIKTNLKISYEAVLSFADPSANFGLILQNNKPQIKYEKSSKKNKILKKDNIKNFSNFKNNHFK